MYPIQQQGFQSDMYSNIPNMALAFTMYTTMFGNGSFVIQPPQGMGLDDDFPSVPYLSLEALLYEQQSSNPQVSPTSIVGGSNTGQQVISSNQTFNDSTGTPRVLTGSQLQT